MKKPSLGEFVRNKRKSEGLTQPELAERAGVGLRFLRELERDKATLRIDKVNLVLQHFGHILGAVAAPRDHSDE